MSSENQPYLRKLSAILYADIVGYTSLMQESEGKALEILQKFQRVTNEKVSSYNGEVIKTYGDGALIIFDSTVEAVQCAQAMQQSFLSIPIVPLRIGIHVGEVIKKDNDVFGNGVNIASRIESMGVAGSVLLSSEARAKIRNQETLETVSLGFFEFKNVAEPIEVFALSNHGLVIPQPGEMKGKLKSPETKNDIRKKAMWIVTLMILLALVGYYFYPRDEVDSLHDVTSLAILDFKNTGQEKDAYLTRGIMSEMRKKFSGLQNLFVIPESSTSSYSGTGLSLFEFGTRINADYILSASISKQVDSSGIEILTINPAIVDVANRKESWTRSYVEDIARTNQLESEIIMDVLTAIGIVVTAEEKKSLEAPTTDNIIAYEAYLAGLDIMPGSHGAKEDFERSLSFFKQATSLDSNFAEAWAYQGVAHRAFHLFGYDTRQSRLDSFLMCTAKAEALEPDLFEAALSRARYKKYIFDYDGSRKLFSELYKRRPNDPEILFETSFTWQREGFSEKALETQLKVREMDPNNLEVLLETCWSAVIVKDYDLALQLVKEIAAINPEEEWGYMLGVFIHWSRGEEGDLEKAAELLENVPDYQSTYPFYFWITQHLYERDFEKALNKVKNLTQVAIEKQDSYYPKDLLEAMIYEQMGNTEEAERHYKLALQHMEEKLRENPNDFKYRNAKGLTHAGLREVEKAKAEAQKAVEVMPIKSDYQLGLDAMYGQMQIYAAIGEVDMALDVMANMFSGPCQYQGFLFTKNPLFANLQDNPRFVDLVAKSQRARRTLLN